MGRAAARRGGGGGGGIPAARQARARLICGGLALVLAALAAAAFALHAGRGFGYLAGLGGVAVVLLLAAFVFARQSFVPWAVAGLGGEYAVALLLHGRTLDPQAPLAAAALFVIAELAYWSVELAAPTVDEEGALGRRAVIVAAGGLAALVVGAALLVLSALPARGGVALDAVGVAAATGAFGLVAWLARRQSIT